MVDHPNQCQPTRPPESPCTQLVDRVTRGVRFLKSYLCSFIGCKHGQDQDQPKSRIVVGAAPDSALLQLLDEGAQDGAVAEVLLQVADALALRVDLVEVDVHPVLEGVGLDGGMRMHDKITSKIISSLPLSLSSIIPVQ